MFYRATRETGAKGAGGRGDSITISPSLSLEDINCINTTGAWFDAPYPSFSTCRRQFPRVSGVLHSSDDLAEQLHGRERSSLAAQEGSFTIETWNSWGRF